MTTQGRDQKSVLQFGDSQVRGELGPNGTDLRLNFIDVERILDLGSQRGRIQAVLGDIIPDKHAENCEVLIDQDQIGKLIAMSDSPEAQLFALWVDEQTSALCRKPIIAEQYHFDPDFDAMYMVTRLGISYKGGLLSGSYSHDHQEIRIALGDVLIALGLVDEQHRIPITLLETLPQVLSPEYFEQNILEKQISRDEILSLCRMIDSTLSLNFAMAFEKWAGEIPLVVPKDPYWVD